jgi:hypothetical protein
LKRKNKRRLQGDTAQPNEQNLKNGWKIWSDVRIVFLPHFPYKTPLTVAYRFKISGQYSVPGFQEIAAEPLSVRFGSRERRHPQNDTIQLRTPGFMSYAYVCSWPAEIVSTPPGSGNTLRFRRYFDATYNLTLVNRS